MPKTLTIGAIVGFIAGVVVFTGYALASWWVCSSLRVCPDHWLPYLIIFLIGVSVFVLLGISIAAFLRGMYRITRVDGTTDNNQSEHSNGDS